MTPKRLSNVILGVLVLTTIFCHLCYAQTTVRPYQFGFDIEEQQHRFEKRDERGIVMGEFGFITADGIYHVTVYATDEEGKFRILAMKNYPYQSPPKTIDMIVVSKNKTTPSTTTSAPPVTTTSRPKFNFGQEACSGCFLTNNRNQKPTEKPIKRKNEIRPLSKTIDDEIPKIDSTISGINTKGQKQITELAKAATNKVILKSNNHKHNNITLFSKSQQTTSPVQSNKDKIQSTQQNKNTMKPKNTSTPSQNQPLTPQKETSGNTAPVLPSKTVNTGKVNNARTPSVVNPTIISGKDSKSSNAAKTGTTVTKNDIDDSGDLYRFKYILDYNGHTETGSRNGNKQGIFYSIGDDNIERTIEYVANEFGFQPRIRWRKLSPNEIKSKKNTLKDYEFVWFKQR